MVSVLRDFQWSSYNQYLENQKNHSWLVRDFILGCFGKKYKTAQGLVAAAICENSFPADAARLIKRGESDSVRIADPYVLLAEPMQVSKKNERV
jgi:hypothetical protein